jgi:hypothetical protein
LQGGCRLSIAAVNSMTNSPAALKPGTPCSQPSSTDIVVYGIKKPTPSGEPSNEHYR